MKFTRDEFEAWREHPMTRLVLDQYVRDQLTLTRETHDDEAWNGRLDPEKHASLRERHETLEWIQELSFEELSEWLKTAA